MGEKSESSQEDQLKKRPEKALSRRWEWGGLSPQWQLLSRRAPLSPLPRELPRQGEIHSPTRAWMGSPADTFVGRGHPTTQTPAHVGGPPRSKLAPKLFFCRRTMLGDIYISTQREGTKIEMLPMQKQQNAPRLLHAVDATGAAPP